MNNKSIKTAIESLASNTRNTKLGHYMAITMFAAAILASGCGLTASDRSIKADIATKAKNNLNFAGVNYTVEGGIITLTGTCPSDIAKDQVEQTVKGINVIKGIRYEIQIAQVVVGTDLPLKQKVDSLLATYPAVQADVAQNIIILKGKAKKEEADKLLPAINNLQATRVENQLAIQ